MFLVQLLLFVLIIFAVFKIIVAITHTFAQKHIAIYCAILLVVAVIIWR